MENPKINVYIYGHTAVAAILDFQNGGHAGMSANVNMYF